jgi:copper transporter 1
MSNVLRLAAALLISSLLVHAEENGMNMGMDSGTMQMPGNMMPYLHFTLGDTLWFIGWVPGKPGAMVGACIGLFVLALVDRWISVCRTIMSAHWNRR